MLVNNTFESELDPPIDYAFDYFNISRAIKSDDSSIESAPDPFLKSFTKIQSFGDENEPNFLFNVGFHPFE